MPFYLSLFSFLSSALWMIYWLLGRDFFIAVSTSSGSDSDQVHMFMDKTYIYIQKYRTQLTTGLLSDPSVCLLVLDPLQSPNFIGVPMGMLQLLLYCIYRRVDGAAAEAELRVHGAAADQEKGLKAAVPIAVQVQPQETAASSRVNQNV